MLVIRKEQIDALQRAGDSRWFAERLADLYPDFAAATLGQREHLVQGGVRRAAAFGIDRHSTLQFLAFEQTFHPGCLDEEAFGWARDILNNDAESPAQRVKHLRQATVRHLLEKEAREEQDKQDQLSAEIAADEEGAAEAVLP